IPTFVMSRTRLPRRHALFPYTTLFRSAHDPREPQPPLRQDGPRRRAAQHGRGQGGGRGRRDPRGGAGADLRPVLHHQGQGPRARARHLPSDPRGAPRRDPGGQRRGARNRRDVLPPDRQNDAVNPRVLLADDEDSLRWVLEKGLRQAGYEVTSVKDGPGALQAFEAEPFDLVFLDVRMPGVDGLAVLARLRELR